MVLAGLSLSCGLDVASSAPGLEEMPVEFSASRGLCKVASLRLLDVLQVIPEPCHLLFLGDQGGAGVQV